MLKMILRNHNIGNHLSTHGSLRLVTSWYVDAINNSKLLEGMDCVIW
jgi:hypothetical protein